MVCNNTPIPRNSVIANISQYSNNLLGVKDHLKKKISNMLQKHMKLHQYQRHYSIHASKLSCLLKIYENDVLNDPREAKFSQYKQRKDICLNY